MDFPETLRKRHVYTVDFDYSGSPTETGRFGGITFKKDPAGHSWVRPRASTWARASGGPDKDQYRDEVEDMRLSVAIPSDLVDVSNGRFVRKVDLGDGYTRWDWQIHYPINSYSVSLNIGDYAHFTDTVDGQTLDFWALAEDLDKAKRQFVQAKPMMQAFQKVLRRIPVQERRLQARRSALSRMDTRARSPTATVSPTATSSATGPASASVRSSTSSSSTRAPHEWFGNAVTAADVSDEWIHEAWATYAEGVYVEHLWGKPDGLKYLNGYTAKVRNREPILAPRGVNRMAPQDMYFKGALFINTLRSIVDDDARWWAIVRDYYREFQYRDIMTEDVVRFFNRKTGRDLTAIFDQYLRRADLPTLELRFDDAGTVDYRWKADEPAFDMPIKVGRRPAW